MSLPTRLADKIEVADCWYWTGYTRKDGYAPANYQGKRWAAHRLVWTLLVGPIPEGLQLDHLCRVRHCVNPDHLEPVTPAENTRRGARATKMACPQGHPYEGDNLMIVAGERFCRTCHRARNRAYQRELRQSSS